MQPDRVWNNAGLDQDEAEQDGTALIGHAGPAPHGRPDNRPSPKQIGEDWNRISSRIAQLFASGVADNDPRTQEAINEHYRWLCHFWVPDRDSYLRLANLYVNQPKFRKRIERKKPEGMAAYMRDAMTAYAWARLR